MAVSDRWAEENYRKNSPGDPRCPRFISRCLPCWPLRPVDYATRAFESSSDKRPCRDASLRDANPGNRWSGLRRVADAIVSGENSRIELTFSFKLPVEERLPGVWLRWLSIFLLCPLRTFRIILCWCYIENAKSDVKKYVWFCILIRLIAVKRLFQQRGLA